MIDCPTIDKRSIRHHYDLSTLFYRLLWGPHIHHGLWDGDESPRRAQQRLTETVVRCAGLRGGERVLDVGCGMGASAIYLAKMLDCHVTGVTLSRLQQLWATATAAARGVSQKTRFHRADAEQITFPSEAFDLLWSIECTEHLYDKSQFFERAAGWLAPGGGMAICAWLAGDEPLSDNQRQTVYDVCEGFLCPSLGTAADYVNWIEAAGLSMEGCHDWTSRVWQTWEICRRRVRRSRVRGLARLVDPDTVRFLDRFGTILEAYQSGAMKYGCFIARRR